MEMHLASDVNLMEPRGAHRLPGLPDTELLQFIGLFLVGVELDGNAIVGVDADNIYEYCSERLQMSFLPSNLMG